MNFNVDVKPTPEQLAAEFCEWSDDKQAAFFVEVARTAGRWGIAERRLQWIKVGERLRGGLDTPEREAAREFLVMLASEVIGEAGAGSPAVDPGAAKEPTP